MRKTLLLCSLLLAAFSVTAQVLLTEGFNVTGITYTPPTGWSLSGTGSTTGCNGLSWAQVPSGGFICSVNGTPQPRPAGQTGSGMAGYNSWDIAIGGVSELVTPVLDFSALGTYTLSFWVYNQATFYEHDSLRVFVNTSPTSVGGTMLFASDPNYNASPTGWAQYVVSIPTTYTSATNYIIFRGYSRYGYDVFFDEVEVTRIPPTPCTGTPLTPSVSNTAFTNPLCGGSNITLNGVDPNLPTTSGIAHQWQSAPTATGPWTNVTGGTGATTLTYNTGAIFTSAWYRVTSTCTNNNVTANSSAFFVPVGAPQPGTISGSSTFCPGDPEIYSVPSVSGTTYTWTLPTGWSGSSSTASITVTPGTTAGNISVTATTSCGSSIPQTMPLVPGSAPATPGAITGNDNICFGTTQNYSITAVGGATSYIWTLPSGWTGTSTTNNITTTANSTPGNVTVKAINGCGQSPATSLPVSVITALANPGAITGKDTVCSGALHAYSITPVPGATSYTWVLPSGWSGTTTDTSIQIFAGTGGGTLSVTAYVSCATSPTATKTIAVQATVNPSVTISVPATLLCQGTPITVTANPTFPGNAPSYQWQKNGVNVIAFGNTYTNTLAPGDSVSVTMTSNAICAANSIVTSNTLMPYITPAVMPGVSINTVPPINICKGTPITFTTISNGTGSLPTYQWFKNGVIITGANSTTYTDATLSNGDTLSVQMTTTAQCAVIPTASSNKVGVRVTNIVTPTVSITVSPSDKVTEGEELTFTASQNNGGATPDYQWIRNGMNIPFETNSTYVTTSLKPGDHISVKMLSYAECVDQELVSSNTIVLKSAVGIGEHAGLQSATLSIYPNPTSGRFAIAAKGWTGSFGRQVHIDVLNNLGQVVHQFQLTPTITNDSWQTQVVLSESLANGHYTLRVRNDDGSFRATAPFILNR